MSPGQTKVKNLGSIYVNTKKGTSDEVIARVRKAIEFLKNSNAYLAISIKNDEGEYTKMTGFFNSYKKDAKDPDLVVRESLVVNYPKKSAPKSQATKKQVDDFESDDSPF